MDEYRRVVDAVLTAGERIVAVSGLDEVHAQAADHVEFVDLHGATMTPGLVDTHPHMLHWSWTTAMQVPLWDCRNHADIVAAIKAEADQTPDGEVILCSPVGERHFFHKRSYRDLAEAVLPDRHVLDQATIRPARSRCTSRSMTSTPSTTGHHVSGCWRPTRCTANRPAKCSTAPGASAASTRSTPGATTSASARTAPPMVSGTRPEASQPSRRQALREPTRQRPRDATNQPQRSPAVSSRQ